MLQSDQTPPAKKKTQAIANSCFESSSSKPSQLSSPNIIRIPPALEPCKPSAQSSSSDSWRSLKTSRPNMSGCLTRSPGTTKIDYRKRGTLILTSLLEDLVGEPVRRRPCKKERAVPTYIGYVRLPSEQQAGGWSREQRVHWHKLCTCKVPVCCSISLSLSLVFFVSPALSLALVLSFFFPLCIYLSLPLSLFAFLLLSFRQRLMAHGVSKVSWPQESCQQVGASQPVVPFSPFLGGGLPN